jgi:hypothetical protein
MSAAEIRAVLDRIHERRGQVAALIAEARRQWWRPARISRLRRQARELHRLTEQDFGKLGFPRRQRSSS